MDWLWLIAGAAALLLFILNLDVTLAVARCDCLDAVQKWGQSAVIWLLPVFGAKLALFFVLQRNPDVVPTRFIACSGIGGLMLYAFANEQTWESSGGVGVNHPGDFGGGGGGGGGDGGGGGGD